MSVILLMVWVVFMGVGIAVYLRETEGAVVLEMRVVFWRLVVIVELSLMGGAVV